MADTPTLFDVIVMPNLYGDILSDVAAQIAGSVGLAGSANIGTAGAMFEAIHGSAPRRAGQNIANPSGLILASVQMLVHIGLPVEAALIHNAWLKTLEDGIHTYDIFKEKISKEKAGTKEFAQAVAARLGQKPETLPAVSYASSKKVHHKPPPHSAVPAVKKELIGADAFIQWNSTREELVFALSSMKIPHLKLKLISNRGVQVWPSTHPETLCSDCWRCRFIRENSHQPLSYQALIDLVQALVSKHFDITQIQSLFLFDGHRGYSVLQDE